VAWITHDAFSQEYDRLNPNFEMLMITDTTGSSHPEEKATVWIKL
jgi:hypothetical protein